VAIIATGKPSAATSGKVVAVIKAADASLRSTNPAADCSASEAAAAYAATVETAAASAMEATATSTVTATSTTAASHSGRSKR
jgi:hypothetical protein